MSEPFLGMIAIYGFNFAPRGWAYCNGQILPIAQNTALFSLLGTMYGGNGQTTFGLPDLRGRFANHFGQGPGLSSYDQGQVGGTENVTLSVTQIPAHGHPIAPPASTNSPTASKPTNSVPAAGNIYDAGPGNATMFNFQSGLTGGNQPAPIMNPYLTLNYCIALEGIFPSRN
jgi:microcystin-dependent protein